MAETEKERHLKIDGREDLDQILKEMTRNETTHKQVQPCSRDREGQRLRPYYKNRILIIPPDEKSKRKSEDFTRESNQKTKKNKRQRPDSGSKGAAGVGKPAKQT
ncbi:hypothetical protein F2Q69_00060047 [Brassica cretica]|uniref:Uncharacterized protein n=1 Tax=Brassica cretica TaxID=69181 RepID=A0A8S9RM19_BRACR|nr:hypothetical protein F2Q69_00060047 [Brassica cretica]